MLQDAFCWDEIKLMRFYVNPFWSNTYHQLWFLIIAHRCTFTSIKLYIRNIIIRIAYLTFASFVTYCLKIRKKYREPCTFAMYISKKSRRFFKIMKDFKNFARFFWNVHCKCLNSSDKMNFSLKCNENVRDQPTNMRVTTDNYLWLYRNIL